MSSQNKIQQNVSLKKYTTFKIGGLAKFFVEVKNTAELKESLIWAKANNSPVFILGGGSNLLVSDQGFNGLVIKINNIDLKINQNLAYAGAGINLNKLVIESLKNNLIGLEKLAGIPGTLGGAIRGNAGAWGSQVGDFVKTVVCFDSQDLIVKKFNTTKCQFTYRSSLFKENKNLIIWFVELKLKVRTIQESSAAQQVIKENLAKRKNTQPDYPSAGCVFKNLKNKQLKDFVINNPHLEIPEKFLENKAIPAAWLIEASSLKGQKSGGAQISEQHANFIVNINQATADDVLKLIALTKTHVYNKFKVQLQEEIELVGCN